MSVSVSSSTNCPYVKCENTAVPVADHIYRCEHCWRLSMRCENSRCGYLNRPFGKYCRRCRDEVSVSNWEGGSGAEIWARAARYGKQPLGPVTAEADTVFDFSLLRNFQVPRAMLSAQFVQGLLAVHQAGGFLGVFHPFRGSEHSGEFADANIWSSAELIRSRPDMRPFAPLLLDDHKHLLFSSPAGVHCLHLWSLPGWAYDEQPRYRPLVDASATDSPQIVAPPVVLGEEQFGLLARDDAQHYHWAVFDLSEGQSFADNSHKLPLEGTPCQVLPVGRDAVAFATPLGHWVWRAADAAAGNVEAMVRTWPQDLAQGRLLMDLEWQDPRHFHLSRQVLSYARAGGDRQAGRLEWLFTVGANHAHELYQYSVELRSLAATRARNLEVATDKGAFPVGVHADSLDSVALVRSQRLLKCVHAHVHDWPGASAMNVVDEYSGLIFSDPLMIILGSRELESGTGEQRRVMVRSLHYPRDWVEFSLGTILADPLVWARWLFTIERDEERLILRRRALGAADRHLNLAGRLSPAGQQGAAT